MPPELRAREVLDVTEAEFSKDEATGRMMGDVILIKAGRAKNPRNYRPAALQKAAQEGVYNGMRMYVDHSDKPPLRRSMKELVSAVESTRWDPTAGPTGGIRANVEFFDEKFFDYAQRAKKYIGVSADHRIRVNHVREGQQMIEDVLEIAFARSVDWVIYPSAGGEVLQFAKESEGDDQVEWGDITLDDLKANAPQLVEQIKAEVTPAQEGEVTPPTPVITPEQIQAMVEQGVQEAIAAQNERETKRAEVATATRNYIAKSGLPQRVQARIINMFSDATEYVESDVQSAVEDAKEELKELGLGPKITGEGPTGESTKGGKPTTVQAREGVESVFGFEKQ